MRKIILVEKGHEYYVNSRDELIVPRVGESVTLTRPTIPYGVAQATIHGLVDRISTEYRQGHLEDLFDVIVRVYISS